MLNEYKHGIDRIKHQNCEIKASMRIKENSSKRGNSVKQQKDYKKSTIPELDDEIDQLRIKISKCGLR